MCGGMIWWEGEKRDVAGWCRFVYMCIGITSSCVEVDVREVY